MQVMLPIDDGYGKEKAAVRKRDTDGNTVGYRNRNIIIDPRVYTV